MIQVGQLWEFKLTEIFKIEGRIKITGIKDNIVTFDYVSGKTKGMDMASWFLKDNYKLVTKI